MNAQVHDFPQSPQEPPPKPVKKRTITLTNRAPIVIVENEWPVIAESGWGTEQDGPPWGWYIKMKVRQHIDQKNRKYNWQTDTIIHAVYSIYNEIDDDLLDQNQTVRVGRLLTVEQVMKDCWKHILEVGEEMRSRILHEPYKKYVTLVVDGVLANLPAHKE